MKEGQDEMPGLQIVPLESREELKKHRVEIGDWMRHDAIKEEYEPTGQSFERKETLKHLEEGLRSSELHSGKHELVLAAKNGEKILGFLAIETTEAGKKAELKELWTKFEDRSQRTIITKLLLSAKEHLEEKQYRYLDVVSSSEVLLSVARRPEFQYFLRIRPPENSGDGKEDHEMGESSENLEKGH